MDYTDAPTPFTVIWASTASAPYITNPVPVPSQIGTKNGAASYTDGFPPNCFVPIAAGGAGPYGADFNGALYQLTAAIQWVQAGGIAEYDATLQTAIGGYAKGSIVASTVTFNKYWLSVADNNMSDPDTGGANWTTAYPPAVAGPTVNLIASPIIAGTTVSFTADYISIATTIGGPSYTLSNFSETLDGGTVGANGMDTGSLPASGFVSIYAIYNPATNTSALLGTIACQTTVYTSTHMPSGYTASAIVAVWPTNGSSQLIAGGVVGQDFYYALGIEALNLGTATSLTSVSLSGSVPAAARVAHCIGQCIETSAIGSSSYSVFVPSTAFGTPGFAQIIAQVVNQANNGNFDLPLFVPQTAYYLSGHSTAESTLVLLGYKL